MKYKTKNLEVDIDYWLPLPDGDPKRLMSDFLKTLPILSDDKGAKYTLLETPDGQKTVYSSDLVITKSDGKHYTCDPGLCNLIFTPSDPIVADISDWFQKGAESLAKFD